MLGLDQVGMSGLIFMHLTGLDLNVAAAQPHTCLVGELG